jgi:hypothetical protein
MAAHIVGTDPDPHRRSARLRRVQRSRRRARLQALVTTAAWLAGGVALMILVVGGLLNLR